MLSKILWEDWCEACFSPQFPLKVYRIISLPFDSSIIDFEWFKSLLLKIKFSVTIYSYIFSNISFMKEFWIYLMLFLPFFCSIFLVLLEWIGLSIDSALLLNYVLVQIIDKQTYFVCNLKGRISPTCIIGLSMLGFSFEVLIFIGNL